jgi:hypothetical protein
MKQLLIRSSILAFIATANLWGQTPPDKVEISGTDYYRHEYNASGHEPAREVRDSVTVTSVMTYFALPDRSLSPDYDYTTSAGIHDFTKLNTTFAWSLHNAYGTVPSIAVAIVDIAWHTVGIDTLKVREIANISASCIGDEVKIPIAVIARPSIAFDQVSGQYSLVDCVPGVTNTNIHSHSFMVTTTTSSSQLVVTYNLEITKGASTTTSSGIANISGGGAFTIDFNDYAVYEITITAITDRISRKSNVDGVMIPNADKFTYTLVKPAETGPIYHIPNM